MGKSVSANVFLAVSAVVKVYLLSELDPNEVSLILVEGGMGRFIKPPHPELICSLFTSSHTRHTRPSQF